MRPHSNDSNIKLPCIYFELNKIYNKLSKIFFLSQNEEIFVINCNIKDDNEVIDLKKRNIFKIPHINFFEKITINQSIDY